MPAMRDRAAGHDQHAPLDRELPQRPGSRRSIASQKARHCVPTRTQCSWAGYRLEVQVSSRPVPSVFRFAPSPNGEMHLGHALSALIGYERAQMLGGRFLVRIEDIDMGRSRGREFVAGIFADLAWLGIAWEEPVVFQSQRMPAYARSRRGGSRRWACSIPALPPAPRSRLRPPAGRPIPMARRSIPVSSGAAMRREVARRKAAGEPFALRIDMAAAISVAAARLGGRPLDLHRARRGRHGRRRSRRGRSGGAMR